MVKSLLVETLIVYYVGKESDVSEAYTQHTAGKKRKKELKFMVAPVQ